MFTNGDFTVLVNGIQVCKSVHLKNLHLQSKDVSNMIQSVTHNE